MPVTLVDVVMVALLAFGCGIALGVAAGEVRAWLRARALRRRLRIRRERPVAVGPALTRRGRQVVAGLGAAAVLGGAVLVL